MSRLYLYARVRFFCAMAHETAGAAGTRSSLRPLFEEGEKIQQTSGETRRENAESHLLFETSIGKCVRLVIARSASDEAIQNLAAERFWIASLRSQ